MGNKNRQIISNFKIGELVDKKCNATSIIIIDISTSGNNRMVPRKVNTPVISAIEHFTDSNIIKGEFFRVNVTKHRDMYLITTVLRSACNNNAFMFTVRKA